MNYRLTCAAALVVSLIMNVPAIAADWNLAPVNAGAPKPATLAPDTTAQGNAAPVDTSTQAYVKTAEFTVQSPAEPIQDGLHADHRWAAMERCINTASQAMFNSCLASAFLQDGTGLSGSLRRR